MQWRQIPTFEPGRPAPGWAWWHALVGLAAAGVLWWLGHRVAAGVVAGVTVGMGAVTWASLAARRAVGRGFHLAGRAVGRILGVVLLVPIYYLVITPWRLARALRGRDPLARRFEPERASYWEVARRHPTRSLVARTFAYERRPAPAAARTPLRWVRRALVAYAIAMALVGTNFLLGWLIDVPIAPVAGPVDPHRHDVEALKDAPWLPEYVAEFHRLSFQRWHSRINLRYRSYLVWTFRDFAGRYVTMKDGARRTHEPPLAAGVAPVTVELHGGSAAWGWYQRDEHTIASDLARLAAARGIPIRVRNYGLGGYVSSQETLLFAEHCAAGQAPDVAIFYDGANDVIANAHEPAEGGADPSHFYYERVKAAVERPGDPWRAYQGRSAIHMLLNALGLARATGPRPTPLAGPEAAANVRKWYGRNVDLGRHLGESYGTRVFHFWQPTLATKRAHPREALVYSRHEGSIAISRELNRLIGPGGGTPGVIDLGDALDTAPGPVMADFMHHNELGAAAVALRIFAAVEPALEAAAARKRAAAGAAGAAAGPAAAGTGAAR